MSKNAGGRRDQDEGHGTCQRTDFSQSPSSRCAKDLTARRKFEEDLERIGCAGLLNKLWNIKDEGLVREFVEGASNQFDHTVQGKPEKWTALVWTEAYGFKPEGYGWASRAHKYIVGEFSKSINPKDGYAVSNCEDFHAKQVLEFVIPILYLEKPTRVTVTVGNTMFEALMGDLPVDWGFFIYDIVTRMVGLVSKSSHDQPQHRRRTGNKRCRPTREGSLWPNDGIRIRMSQAHPR